MTIRLVSQILKSAGEVRMNIITDIVNHIPGKRLIPQQYSQKKKKKKIVIPICKNCAVVQLI